MNRNNNFTDAKKLAGAGIFAALAIAVSFATSFIKIGYLSLDAGDIIDGAIDCNNGLPEDKIINTTTDKIMELIGVDVADERIVEILNWD